MSLDLPRKVTKEEVAKLHRICKRKDILYLDLRIEFVDHLCELMEAHWQKHPNDSFDQAFLVVYRNFGIYGFMEVSEEHGKVMSKRYHREIMLFMKEWLSVPKIFATLSLLALTYFLCERLEAHTVIATISAVLVISTVVYSLLKRQDYKKSLEGDETILTASITHFMWFMYLFYFCIIYGGAQLYERMLESSIMSTLVFGITLALCIGTIAVLKKYENTVFDLKKKLA